MKKPKRYDRVNLYEKSRQRTFEADVINVGYKNFQVIGVPTTGTFTINQSSNATGTVSKVARRLDFIGKALGVSLNLSSGEPPLGKEER